MAKITLTLCDVRPCTNTADRDFQINGRTLHVCGEGCYAKYWSREYQAWKQSHYNLQAEYTSNQNTHYSERALKLLSNNK